MGVSSSTWRGWCHLLMVALALVALPMAARAGTDGDEKSDEDELLDSQELEREVQRAVIRAREARKSMMRSHNTHSTVVRTDTTIQVKKGARLMLTNYGGDISVLGWSRDVVRIAAEHSSRVAITVEDLGTTLNVKAQGYRTRPTPVSYEISVPAWMPVSLKSLESDITVLGTKGEIEAETVKGDVVVEGGTGRVRLYSVEGSVRLAKAKGRIELTSVNDEIQLLNSEGDVQIEAVNGDVELDQVRSPALDVTTVNGNVRFLGRMTDGGRYRLSTHQGDLLIGLAEKPNAIVTVATFNGDFQSKWPIELQRTRGGRRFEFALGSGSALIELSSFEGDIRMLSLDEVRREFEEHEGLLTPPTPPVPPTPPAKKGGKK